MNKSLLCDGTKHCKDGSDENANICKPCKENMFRCKVGKPKCINETHVCDKRQDCADSSDEKGCNINECSNERVSQCSQICTDLKQGYRCSCKAGYKLDADGKTCKSSCSDYSVHGCSHICIPVNGENICICGSGYALDYNMRSCKHNTKEKPYLLLANKHFVNTFSLSQRKSSYEVLQDGLRNVVAVDFDWKKGRYYWIDQSPGEIRKAKLKGGKVGSSVSLTNDYLPDPFDLSVDWVGRHLYFTDRSRFSIYVGDLEGKFHKKLLEDRINQPLAIVCHPKAGYVYYTTKTSGVSTAGTISSLGMDGTGHRVLVSTGIMYPQGLTLDYVTETLYWSDMALKRIEYISLRKSNSSTTFTRKLLLQGAGEVFSLSLFEDILYYTTWRPFTLHQVHRWSGLNSTMVKKSKYKFYGIQVTLCPYFSFRCKISTFTIKIFYSISG